MHVLVARVHFTRTLEDEEARQALTEAASQYEKSGGFQALYSVRISDREVINVSLWTSQEDAERGFAAARWSVHERIGEIIDGRPEICSGHLIFEHPPGGTHQTSRGEPEAGPTTH
jgi:heme-degrading monooxygenase HmoA